MTILAFTFLVLAGSLAAGFLGALTGLGGGVVIVPLLALVFGVDLQYAIGASLVSVIATSSGAAAAYVKEGYTNIRIGMFLEIATTCGALGGAMLAVIVPGGTVAVIFGVVLLMSAYLSSRPRPEKQHWGTPGPISRSLRLGGSYPTPKGQETYEVYNVPSGFAIMVVAGLLSGLLGIGSGAFKVLAMDQVMRIPFKVSTVYLSRGYIDPGLAMPVMLGVLLGSLLGARVLPRARTPILRWIFAIVVLAMAIQMIYKGLTGNL
jgi:uncharacterized membrane protein YfcA